MKIALVLVAVLLDSIPRNKGQKLCRHESNLGDVVKIQEGRRPGHKPDPERLCLFALTASVRYLVHPVTDNDLITLLLLLQT